MASGKLTALAVERAHGKKEPILLTDGDGLYFRKQTKDGSIAWTLRCRFADRERWFALRYSRSVVTIIDSANLTLVWTR